MQLELLINWLGEHRLKIVLEDNLHKYGMTTREQLSDQAKVEQFAAIVYANLPMSLRIAFSVSIGEEGFRQLVFWLRDQILARDTIDLSWLTQDRLLGIMSTLAQGMNSVGNAPAPAAALGYTVPRHEAAATAPRPSAARTTGWRLRGSTSDGARLDFLVAPQNARVGQTWTVGRNSGQCELALPDLSVSRSHARIGYFPGQGLSLCDLGSSNGTFIEGNRIGADYVWFGSGLTLRFGSLDMAVLDA